MKLQDATVFITGANRGLGLAFARHALAHGARKVAARAFAALENGDSEVAIDEWTQQIKRGLSNEPGIYIDFAR